MRMGAATEDREGPEGQQTFETNKKTFEVGDIWNQ